MSTKAKVDVLFEPIDLPNIRLNNRIVMAPMTRNRSDDELHLANDLMATYYGQRAEAGLIISEGVFVSPRAIGYIRVPGIYTPEQVESWENVTQAVHEKGGRIFAQLWHTGRISHPDLQNGQSPLAPSAINPNFKTYTHEGNKKTVTPKAMSLEEIKTTISYFRKAAANAMKAGFDGVEIHAANGYLFHQFLASCANIRTDKYGGSIPNRCRFLLETLEAIRAEIGEENISIRLNPDLHNSFGISIDETTRPTFDYLIQELNPYNLAFLHLSGFSKSKNQPPFQSVIEMATHFRKIFQGRLMINCGFDPYSAAEVIDQGITDMVSFGIPFIANPDLVKRIRFELPFSEPDRKAFYTSGSEGYTDYPEI